MMTVGIRPAYTTPDWERLKLPKVKGVQHGSARIRKSHKKWSEEYQCECTAFNEIEVRCHCGCKKTTTILFDDDVVEIGGVMMSVEEWHSILLHAVPIEYAV